jgi:hypothetical protein
MFGLRRALRRALVDASRVSASTDPRRRRGGRLDVVVGGSARGARVLFVEVGWRGNANDEGDRDDGDVVHGEGAIGAG